MVEDETEAMATVAADTTLGHKVVEMALRATAPFEKKGYLPPTGCLLEVWKQGPQEAILHQD